MKQYGYSEVKQEIIKKSYKNISLKDFEKEIIDDINEFIEKYREYREMYGKLGEIEVGVQFLEKFRYRFLEKNININIKIIIDKLIIIFYIDLKLNKVK